MRTNIDIDDELLAEAMRALGQTTKKATVEEALRRAARGRRLKDLIERTRGMGWYDDAAAPREAPTFAEEDAPYDAKK